MNRSTILTTLLVVLVLGVRGTAVAAEAAAAPGKHLLRYKFAMGEVLRYDVRHATNTRTTIDESTQQALTQSDSVKAWKVTDVLPSGEIEFVHVVEWIRMSNEAPEQPANKYDSRQDAKPPRGFEQAAAAVGVPLSVIRIAGDGEVTFREEKHPQRKPTDDMPITLRLPKEPIAVGEKWDYSYDVPAERKSGAKIQVRTRRVCTLREVKSGVAVIDVEYQILSPVEPYVNAQLIERISKGTVRFDVARGRVISQEHNVDKRVLGFASTASSMHFVSRLQEKLLPPTKEVAQASHETAAK